MKLLHRPDLYAWSRFDESRNIDFNSYLWQRPGGNVVIDPLPLSDHERARLERLGGVRFIVITNSDHTRDVAQLRAWTHAAVFGPASEREGFPVACDHWVAEGDVIVPGLVALTVSGSKTPGELALLLEESTLITGDLVRAHRAGGLDHLPSAKLADRALAVASLRRLTTLDRVDAVLPGDGWPVFRGGREALMDLAERAQRALS
jgi:glyoxylase-like metal-dependent hydrolase (beta-lactamase superfamily II)